FADTIFADQDAYDKTVETAKERGFHLCLAIDYTSQLLHKGGKIVFADTIFADQDAYDKTVETAKERGFHQLANDLQTEYYTRIPVMQTIFENNGFHVTFTRLNHFVWVMEATKQ
ncbi:hypothetical protein ACT4US_22260, partial [Bacillus sp. HC-Mk]